MQVGTYEAKTHLPALLKRVAEGEEITITKHGKPIARLVPVECPSLERRRQAIARIKELGKGQTLGMPLKEAINEGRP